MFPPKIAISAWLCAMLAAVSPMHAATAQNYPSGAYAASSDPQRLINVIIKPEMIGILVAGDPGRNQSRAYMGNHIQGPPSSRRVELPRGWAERLQQTSR